MLAIGSTCVFGSVFAITGALATGAISCAYPAYAAKPTPTATIAIENAIAALSMFAIIDHMIFSS